MKTSELSGAALDWAVAKCEDFRLPGLTQSLYDWFKAYGPCYSIDWAQGGPIIQREDLQIGPVADATGWYAHKVWGGKGDYTGPTPLIAAMRAYVASKLGDEVDVPEELA